MNLDEIVRDMHTKMPMATQEDAITFAKALVAELAKQEPKGYTEGHCAEKKKEGGCQLHNLHCGYPACDRKPVAAPVIPAGWAMVPEHPEGQWSNPDLINIMVDAFNESEGGKYDGMLAAYKALIATPKGEGK